MKKNFLSKKTGAHRSKYIEAQYEVRIPQNVKGLIEMPGNDDPEGQHEFKEKLREELLLYYRTGTTRQTIGRIYSQKQLRIKRLIWLAGGGARVCHACNISRSTMSRWIDRESVHYKYWPVFAKLLEGKVSVGDIAKIMIGE